MWRRDWISRHQKTETEIYYKFDIYDTSKGWISKANLKDIPVFDGKFLSTNSKGLRGKTEFDYRKKPGTIRIVILGDSMTFGDEVSDNETYSYYLQKFIPQAEIINLGVHGYGHDQMLILLMEEGLKYEPDYVILGFNPHNMSRNLLGFRDYAKPKFVWDGKQLKRRGTPVPSPAETIQWDWARPRLIDILSIIHHGVKKKLGLYAREEEEITKAILAEIVKLSESMHAMPIFVYLPWAEEVFDRTALTRGENYMFAACRQITKVKCFSTRPYFAEQMSKGVMFKNQTYGHWAPEGHRAVAEAIELFLIDMGIAVKPDKVKHVERYKAKQGGA